MSDELNDVELEDDDGCCPDCGAGPDEECDDDCPILDDDEFDDDEESDESETDDDECDDESDDEPE